MYDGRGKMLGNETITKTSCNIILNRIKTLEEYEQRDKDGYI